MLSLKVSSIVQILPAFRLPKCCHVDKLFTGEKMVHSNMPFFLHLLISFFYMHFAQSELLQY